MTRISAITAAIRSQQSVARAADEDFMREVGTALFAGLELKRVMLAKGLRRASAKCPRCGSETLQGALVGRRNHLRLWCDTPGCNMEMME